MPLNEDCGFIQWVPNTIPLRNILVALYANRGIEASPNKMGGILQTVTSFSDEKDIISAFDTKVLSL